jgi:uncharacterized protein DUF4167
VKRSRGRGRRPQNNHNRAFDSTGPDVKIRGTAAHVYEKYLQLARDANSAGDRVMAENYLQHAEHYYRTINSNGEANRPRPPMRNDGQPGPDGGQGGNSQADNGQGGNNQPGNSQGGNGQGGNGFDGQAGSDGQDGDEAQPHQQHQPQSQAKATAVDPADDTEN